MTFRIGFVVSLWFFGGLAAAKAVAADGTDDASFRQEVLPFTKKYCLDCHSGKEAEAKLAIDQFTDLRTVDAGHESWAKIRKYLQARIMPPPDADQPPDAELRAVIAWIDRHFSGIDCRLKRDPGRVTLRRLNRSEYNNTIRDLTGVDFHPADDFPVDDVGYGFDNIGDVLSMPPILLEKYLAAADAIVDRAIYIHTPDKTPKQRFLARDVEHKGGNAGSIGWSFPSNGEAFTEVDLPADGQYMLRGRAVATQAGDELAKMAFKFDDRQIHVADVSAAAGAPENYETKITAGKGKHRFCLAFVNDFYDPDNPDPKRRDRNLGIEFLEVQGPLDGPPPELPDSHKKILFCQPAKGHERDCAEKILSRFASRAFRRPAANDEVKRLVTFVDLARENGESFERGIQLAVEAVLVSPHFLFRVEQDPRPGEDGADADGIRLISEYELATRLSYFLWSSMPDDELFHEAYKGRLRKNLRRQVERMLKDPKSRAFADNFVMQWLEVRKLESLAPDPKRFPAFNEELRAAMMEETLRFFIAIMQEDRSLLDLIDADFTFLNERLAKHYGIRDVTGPEFRRVQLKDRDRGGIITQASVLTITSNPTRTSAVKRGKWILEQLLDMSPPPPPPNSGDLEDDPKAAATGSLRQRLEQHRANPSCASCHTLMDPLGFGLENFDAIGAWRDREGAYAVDASGSLPDGSSFKGPRELKEILKRRKDDFVRCVAGKMLTYALGRGLAPYDQCALDDIAARLAKNDYKFSELIHAVVESDPFQKRRSK